MSSDAPPEIRLQDHDGQEPLSDIVDLHSFEAVAQWAEKEHAYWLALFAQQPNVHKKPYVLVRESLFRRLDQCRTIALRGIRYEKRKQSGERVDDTFFDELRAQITDALPNYDSGEALLSSSARAKYLEHYESKQLRLHVYAVFTGLESDDADLEAQAISEVYRFGGGPERDDDALHSALERIRRLSTARKGRANALADKPSIWHWDSLRGLGQNKLAQLTVLVPILGYFILFGENYADYFRLSFVAEDRPTGSLASWRVYLLYFGFSFLAIASFLFSVYCPKVIKQHENGAKYAALEAPTLSEAEVEELVRDVSGRAFLDETGASLDDYMATAKHVEVISSGLAALNIGQIANLKLREQAQALKKIHGRVSELPIPALLSKHYGYEASSMSSRRSAIITIYAIGFSLVLVPSVVTFGQVLVFGARALISHVVGAIT